MASQLALVVKNPLANTRDTDSIPGPGIFLGIGKATHSSILAWKITWAEELWPMGPQSVGGN